MFHEPGAEAASLFSEASARIWGQSLPDWARHRPSPATPEAEGQIGHWRYHRGGRPGQADLTVRGAHEATQQGDAADEARPDRSFAADLQC
jgi:hypothetical protein